MKKSKLPKQALIILSIALVLVISPVMWSSAQITQDTEEEVQSTLRDVATQNALIVQQELRENFNLLYSLADAISVSPDAVNAKSIAAQLGSFVSTYEFKRIGFVSPDGQVISTDGYVQDLSSRDFLRMVCRDFLVLPIPSRIASVLRSPSMYSAFPYMIRVIPLSVFYLPPIGTSILKKF